MNIKCIIKSGLITITLILLTSCSKQYSDMDHASATNGTKTHGLGRFSQFSGQEEGESYTTQAPHNQVYLFSYDSNQLASKYLPSVNAQIDYLKTHPRAKILLAGHTDERGSREYNIALGERRANTIAALIRMAGVDRSQMRVVSYGKERPAYFGHNDASYRQNRRVELTYEATR